MRRGFPNWSADQPGKDTACSGDRRARDRTCCCVVSAGRSGELSLAELGCGGTCAIYDRDLGTGDRIFSCGAQGCSCFVPGCTEVLLFWYPQAQVACAVIARPSSAVDATDQSHWSVAVGMVSSPASAAAILWARDITGLPISSRALLQCLLSTFGKQQMRLLHLPF